MPGLSAVLLGAVVAIGAVQSGEVSGSAALLAGRGLWAVTPVCVAALASVLGFAAAQRRAGESPRAFALDRLRVAAPIYALAVLAAVFALGPLLSNRGVRNYLGEPETYAYLLNLVGWPQFALPGVFEFNDLSAVVNANVWVAPFVAMLIAALCAPLRGRVLRFAPLILAGVIAAGAVFVEALDVLPGDPLGFAALAVRGEGLSALLGGLLGIAAWHGRSRIRLRRGWAVGAAGLLAVAALVGDATWAAIPALRVGIAVPAAYLALYLGLAPLPLAALTQRVQPYLPGLWLFSFPLQQLVAERGPRNQTWLVNYALALPAAAALAWAWWRLVGRRLLSARQRLAAAEVERLTPPMSFARGRRRPIRVAPLLQTLAVAALIVVLALGMVAMLYVASQPDPGGM